MQISAITEGDFEIWGHDMRLHLLAWAYGAHVQWRVFKPRKQVRHVDISLVGLALHPYSMRVNVHYHIIALISWWECRRYGCALPEIWHSSCIYRPFSAQCKNSRNFAGWAPFWANNTILESRKNWGCQFQQSQRAILKNEAMTCVSTY